MSDENLDLAKFHAETGMVQIGREYGDGINGKLLSGLVSFCICQEFLIQTQYEIQFPFSKFDDLDITKFVSVSDVEHPEYKLLKKWPESKKRQCLDQLSYFFERVGNLELSQ